MRVALALGCASALVACAAPGAVTPRDGAAASPPPRVCALPDPIPPPLARYRAGAGADEADQRPNPRDREELQRLNQHIASAPGDAEALAARGDLYAQRGLRERADADFARAERIAPGLARVHWARGWADFSLGDVVCAVVEWQAVAEASGADAAWIPQTLAVGYWAAGEHAAAIAYYAAAARSFPERFATRAALDVATQYWAKAERVAIGQVFDAWAASAVR